MKFDYEEDFLDDIDLDNLSFEDLFGESGYSIIQCNDELMNEIMETLEYELGNMMEDIREDAGAVYVNETETGVEVHYPCGEIYGYASDYVQAVPHVFKKLKKKYTDIAIRGIAYEYETVQHATFGPLFYCSAEDTELTVTYEWQECTICGKILESDTLYNSSQRDFKEGNHWCLCSPTCMLEYSLCMEHQGLLEPNESFSENEIEDIYESDDEDIALKELLLKRIEANIEDYIDDFKGNFERIIILCQKDDLKKEEKDILLGIIQRIQA